MYCIKHAYKFLLREQVGFAAVLLRLRKCVSCLPTDTVEIIFSKECLLPDLVEI